jgi:CubicO group peptidase (beta-lactamase class C family)
MVPARIRRAGAVLLCAVSGAAAQPADLPALLDSLFLPFTGKDLPGASVMVIREGKVLAAAAYGMAEVAKGIPASTATNYRLASVTKQFTAMSVMILKDRGLLSYDQPLTDFFPSFARQGGKITIRHLLHHTSGLIDYEECIPDTATVQVLDRDVLRLVEKVDTTYFPPGTRYRYSNTGYALLALIVEKVSGMSFARFLEENVFRPVGMNRTVAYERGVSEVPNRAYGYVPADSAGKRFVQRDQSLTSAVLGDGGVYSSVEDLRKWIGELEEPDIVKRATLREAFTENILPSGERTRYGFGWTIDEFRSRLRRHHSGGTISFRTHLMWFPEDRLAIIVLMNRSNGDPGTIAERIAEYCLGTGG